MENSKIPASKKIDFDAINQAALNNLESLLRQWLPGGKRSGQEYVVSNPTRIDVNPSLSINVVTGVWYDFGNGDKGGDPVSLFAYIFHNNKQGTAGTELGDILGVSAITKPEADKPKKIKSAWVAIRPPLAAPEPPKAHRYRGLPEKVWSYRDFDGHVIGYVNRFKTSDGGKEVLPLTWCKNLQTGKQEWRRKAFEEPRPLYGLDRLAAKPDATVLIVEDEKCALVAAEHLPDLACVTWPGGSKAIEKADWGPLTGCTLEFDKNENGKPLTGRNVIILPDCDSKTDKRSGILFPEDKQPGMKAALKIAAILQTSGCRVKMLNIPKPGIKKDGYDIVDMIEEGLTGDALRDYLRSNTRLFTAQEPAKTLEQPPSQDHVIQKRHTRETLDQLIDETDNIDVLVVDVVMQVANSGLVKPLTELLLSKIAKKASVSKSSLQEVINSFSGKGTQESNNYGDGWIDELNLKHAVIPIGGRILILNRDFDPVMNKNLITFSSRGDFETRYCNRDVFFKGDKVGLGTFWLHHARRSEFDGMVMSPGEDKPGYFNFWAGWGVEPKPGCCKKYLEFVQDVICSGNDELFNYIIFWAAHLLQRPQELPETALVFRGVEGAGKDTFVKPLKEIVGNEHFLMLSSLNQIIGRFSGHLSNALLVFCNESIWGGDKSAQGVLKSMVTDDTQPIEFKGRDLVMVKSYRRMIFATNENWAVPRGADDRRYVIADVSNSRKDDKPYFKVIRDELENGGTAALMAYLMAWPLGDWHPRNIPKNLKEQGWELKIRSGGSIVQWWFDMLSQGWLENSPDILRRMVKSSLKYRFGRPYSLQKKFRNCI